MKVIVCHSAEAVVIVIRVVTGKIVETQVVVELEFVGFMFFVLAGIVDVEVVRIKGQSSLAGKWQFPSGEPVLSSVL